MNVGWLGLSIFQMGRTNRGPPFFNAPSTQPNPTRLSPMSTLIVSTPDYFQRNKPSLILLPSQSVYTQNCVLTYRAIELKSLDI